MLKIPVQCSARAVGDKKGIQPKQTWFNYFHKFFLGAAWPKIEVG